MDSRRPVLIVPCHFYGSVMKAVSEALGNFLCIGATGVLT